MSCERLDDEDPLQAIPFFHGATADEAWVGAVRAVTGSLGEPIEGRGGATKEILHSTMRITDPTQRWVFSRCPAINPAFAIAEAFWILGGRDDARFVNFWNPALPRFAGHGARYDGAYGKRLRSVFGRDQIELAIDSLAGNPSSRQVVLQIWDPRVDLSDDRGRPPSPDVPCNVCSILKVRSGRLEWLQVLRSNDVFRGTPYNVVQFTILQEYIAGCLGLELGSFVLVADSLHAYEADMEKYRVGECPHPRSECRIALPRASAKAALGKCIGFLEELSSEALVEARFAEIVRAEGLPSGHADMVRIAAADSARRRGWEALSKSASDSCRDPALRVIWAQWVLDRTSAPSSMPRKVG
ncbi:thymidylate synthase [Bosea sp. BE271]|jgi:thymidylate synthase|uniref:thymidylate synthase n=1 Tax=Bosea TaxID=85413 RepID=UPI00274053AD|nr:MULTISPECIES: thymidylate synthase [Bosea]MDR6831573.1 thymidylate synthase [Bosea robiniae]MDR6898282.1 thymidylate synthase [Bosea sp. BE109]MDR7141675.1 thymidylate synthase [Bosea sp. BE168]MDR7178302.1 thymidylate synthase [Bosea sp. BE271]